MVLSDLMTLNLIGMQMVINQIEWTTSDLDLIQNSYLILAIPTLQFAAHLPVTIEGKQEAIGLGMIAPFLSDQQSVKGIQTKGIQITSGLRFGSSIYGMTNGGFPTNPKERLPENITLALTDSGLK